MEGDFLHRLNLSQKGILAQDRTFAPLRSGNDVATHAKNESFSGGFLQLNDPFRSNKEQTRGELPTIL